MVSILFLPKQIAAIHFTHNIADVVGDAVSNKNVCFFLELSQVIHHSGVEEFSFFERGLVHDDFVQPFAVIAKKPRPKSCADFTVQGVSPVIQSLLWK